MDTTFSLHFDFDKQVLYNNSISWFETIFHSAVSFCCRDSFQAALLSWHRQLPAEHEGDKTRWHSFLFDWRYRQRKRMKDLTQPYNSLSFVLLFTQSFSSRLFWHWSLEVSRLVLQYFSSETSRISILLENETRMISPCHSLHSLIIILHHEAPSHHHDKEDEHHHYLSWHVSHLISQGTNRVAIIARELWTNRITKFLPLVLWINRLWLPRERGFIQVKDTLFQREVESRPWMPFWFGWKLTHYYCNKHTLDILTPLSSTQLKFIPFESTGVEVNENEIERQAWGSTRQYKKFLLLPLPHLQLRKENNKNKSALLVKSSFLFLLRTKCDPIYSVTCFFLRHVHLLVSHLTEPEHYTLLSVSQLNPLRQETRGVEMMSGRSTSLASASAANFDQEEPWSSGNTSKAKQREKRKKEKTTCLVLFLFVDSLDAILVHRFPWILLFKSCLVFLLLIISFQENGNKEKDCQKWLKPSHQVLREKKCISN